MDTHKVAYGDKTIAFELERKKMKTVRLRIRPDGRVIVSANPKVPHSFIEGFVREKGHWINRKLKQFKDTANLNGHREYVSGETVRYLGRQYRLKVFESDEEEVKYYRGYIHIYVRDKNNYSRKEELYEHWLKKKAKEAIHDSLDRIYPRLEKHNIAKPTLTVRRMSSRWGSCSANKGKITINIQLVKAPKACIDYVILHELIHFKHPNHNKNFYIFLTNLMPDWKQRKAILDSEIVCEL